MASKLNQICHSMDNAEQCLQKDTSHPVYGWALSKSVQWGNTLHLIVFGMTKPIAIIVPLPVNYNINHIIMAFTQRAHLTTSNGFSADSIIRWLQSVLL